MASAPAKPKVSPVIVVMGIVALGAVAYLLKPDDSPAPVKKPVTSRSAAQTAVAADGTSPADLIAKFAPYVSPNRDAFMPLVQTATKIGPGNNVPGGRGTWLLTGISASDGKLTALIENSSAGLSQFLQTGDTWNHLRVINVGENAVTFENAKGQKTELMFPAADGKVAVKGDDAAAFGGEPAADTPPTTAPAAGAAPPVIIVQGGGGQNNGGGDNGGNGGGGFPGGGGGFPGGGGGFPGGGGGGFPGGGGGFPGGGGGFPGGGGGFPGGGGGGFPGGGGGFPGGGGGFPGQGTFNNSLNSATALGSNTRNAEDRLGKAILK